MVLYPITEFFTLLSHTEHRNVLSIKRNFSGAPTAQQRYSLTTKKRIQLNVYCL